MTNQTLLPVYDPTLGPIAVGDTVRCLVCAGLGYRLDWARHVVCRTCTGTGISVVEEEV